jgi:hypothetical protein
LFLDDFNISFNAEIFGYDLLIRAHIFLKRKQSSSEKQNIKLEYGL